MNSKRLNQVQAAAVAKATAGRARVFKDKSKYDRRVKNSKGDTNEIHDDEHQPGPESR